MRVIIVEDEKPAREKLRQMILAFDHSIEITGTFPSVREAVTWIKEHKETDLAFFDIQLSDGLSFEIFKQCTVAFPVIFTTAFDEYIMKGFEYNGIDYLLKPLKKEMLENSLTKYLKLKAHFTNNVSSLISYFLSTNKKYKDRIVVKKGTDFKSIKTDEIAYFYIEHQLVFLIDHNGNRYLVDNKTLADLEENMDPEVFFRLNRKYLAHISAISLFKPHYKGKILIILSPKVTEEVAVSQERASLFKNWIEKGG